MKTQNILLALAILITSLSFGQTNTFPSSGNVGVGTTTPNAKLEIYNTAQAGHLLLTADDNPNADATRIDIDFRVANQGHTVGRISSSYDTSADGGSGGLRFYTRNKGNLIENVRINSIGNLGIGTTAPLSGGGGAKWLTIEGTTSYGGGLISSIGGVAKAYYYWEAGFAKVQGAIGEGIKLDVNNSTTAMTILANSNVGIGTTTPDKKLTVNGTIHSSEVIVDTKFTPDYVFQKYYTGKSELKSDYVMPTLAEIESFTKKNNHLPNVPSAKEIQEKGVSLGEMSNVLLQKVEELTLYAIEQNKYVIEQNKKIMLQQEELERLKKENENYKSLAERLSSIEKVLKN